MAKRSGRRSSKGNKRSRPPTKRQYPRTARLNSLLQQIVADYFERVNDEELDFFTVTDVSVDNDLNRARVFISSLGDEDEELLENLAEHRIAIQRQINAQSHLRKTPQVTFEFDPAIAEGARIDEILSVMGNNEPGDQAEVPDQVRYYVSGDSSEEVDG